MHQCTNNIPARESMAPTLFSITTSPTRLFFEATAAKKLFVVATVVVGLLERERERERVSREP
jgi:hypothetical protein